MAHIYQAFTNFLKHKPILSKSVTSATLASLGDFLCQQLERRYQTQHEDKFNYMRNGRIITYGFVFNGPFLHFIYGKLLPMLGTDRTLKTAVKKILVTSAIFSVVGHAFFFFAMS